MALPFLLAGPILRRVEPQLVAVWVALSRPSLVRLKVWAGLQMGVPAAPVHASMATPVAALRCGTQLFVALAVLDLSAQPAKTLQPGINYAYDLEFLDNFASVPQTLSSLGLLARVDRPGIPGVNHEPLGYVAGALPSFALPPAALTDLKLVYGSCRRPCNEHDDAMVWIDDLVDRSRGGAAAGQNPADPAQRAFALARPHQLFLGGDQIYADDVSPIHLHLCNRAGHELLSGVDGAALDRGERPASLETLTITGLQRRLVAADRPGEPAPKPFPESLRLGFGPDTDPSALPPRALPATLDLFPAGGRLDISQFDAQMTSTDGDSHLFGFGEFMAMHLSVWSNTLWGAERWPDLARLAEAPAQLPSTAQARTINSPMDVALAEYLVPQLADWHELGRPGPGSKLLPGHQAAAAGVRDGWAQQHATAQDYAKLPKPLREFFDRLMKHLRARVVRTLAERNGIATLAQVTLVRGLGEAAIKNLAHKIKQDRKNGQPDVWRQWLDTNLVAGDDAAWTTFLTQALTAVRGPQDDPLSAAAITAIVSRWGKAPASEERAARTKAGLAALTRDDLAREIESLAVGHVWKIYRRLRGHEVLLKRFERGLPKVRRALANVPTYMIFDDHDVTDDWNLNPLWCERVLKVETSLGRQLVRNALAAYVLCQDWGNDPQRYTAGTPSSVLANAAALFGSPASPQRPDGGATRALDGFFGLNKLPQPESLLEPNGRFAPVTAPMTFHFQVVGPAHRVVALDNRTRRSFASKNGPPGNIALSEMAAQVPAPVAGDGRLLVVVAPLQVLAPSVFDEIIAPGAYRAFDLSKPTERGALGRGFHLMAGINPDAIEGWAFDPTTFEALLERLAAHRRVLLLSGDVHYSAATQMSYWTKGRADPARFVQFTCSGFKNVMPSFITAVDRPMGFVHEMVRAEIGAERLGWKAGARDAFAFPPGTGLADVPQVLRKRIARAPSFLPTLGWPVDRSGPEPVATTVKAGAKPDFAWRLLPVFDVRPDAERPKMAGPRPYVGTPPDAAKLQSAATSFEAYRKIAARHAGQIDRLANGRQILFRANVAVVRFEERDVSGPAGPRRVLEAVHEIVTAVPDPDSPVPRERPEPREQSNPTPLVYVVQRAALTADPAEPRPDDQPLKPPLGALLR